MRNLISALILGLTLSACGDQGETTSVQSQQESGKESAAPAVVEKSETEKLNEWFEVKYEEELMMSPIQLTFQGRKERYGELDDFSEEAAAKKLAWKRQTVEDMEKRFNYDGLSKDAKISYDLWKHQYEDLVESERFKRNGYVFEQMNGVHAFLPTFLMSFHNVENVSDMEAFVSRISAVARGIKQLIEISKLNAAEGVRPPRFAYEIVVEESKKLISGKPFDTSDKDSSLFGNAQEKLNQLLESGAIDQAKLDELLTQVQSALVSDFMPAYQSLVSYLESELPKTDSVAKGVSELPNGGAYYEHLLKSQTTTDKTAEEIHQLGLSEVARLRSEMEELKSKSGFEGSLQEFFVFIRDSREDPQFYYPNTDEGRNGYITDATAAIDNIKAELPNYFGILPKADLVVKRVEPFREQDGAPQHYFPGTPDGSRPGIYYAHLSDMKAMPKNELEVIAYHEGLPGHHMQIAIAQELEGVPTFRTQAGFTSYAEGWALYSERLAREMPNTFSNVYSDFGRLGSEIWRAIRLVVDTGMHHKGWSQQQAIDYFAENSPAPLATIEAEIRRYLVIPGQATTYKIGMIHIQRLREMAEKELGDKFNIKSFHDTVLGGGALPLNMLERQVVNWVASQK